MPANISATRTSRTVPLIATLGAMIWCAQLFGGPLSPPPGPVTGTGKTIAEVEPRIAINAVNTPGDANYLFKITQPGSYYLTGNINGVSGKSGIGIDADGVTIDLNGFEMLGGAGSQTAIQGLVVGGLNLTVKNGSIRTWGRFGVYLGGGSYGQAASFRLSDLRVSGCTFEGIAGGYYGVGGTISNCSSYDNGGNGISCYSGCTITSCSTMNNGSYGIVGGSGAVISQCTAAGNELIGIHVSEGSVVSDCTAYENGTSGIVISTTSTTTGGAVNNCSSFGNGADGILVGAGASISTCSVLDNAGSGIDAQAGVSILDCTIRSNSLDGIRCTSHALIRGNDCTLNGVGTTTGAGIHTTSSNNRIEGNNCTNNDLGIDVDVAGSIIIRNSCANNGTNWSIAANNIYGPIIDRTAPASAAVSSNAAAGTMGSTDPNANFTY